MRADWVAVGVRARAMATRCVGPTGARALAASPSLDAAIGALGATPYGRAVRPGAGLAEAQRAVTATLLWNLRVLAGWAPRVGVTVLRTLAGTFEIANVVDHVRSLAGADTPAPYQLGALATAWPRSQGATSIEDLRRVLTASPWGDPGADTAGGIGTAMRASLYDRMMTVVPAAAAWAGAAALLLVAREQVLSGHELTGRARVAASRVVGQDAVSAGSLADLAGRAPRGARWALSGVDEASDLWMAEQRWWDRVGRDAREMAGRAEPDSAVLVGAAAVMATDAWRVRVALELADHGGLPWEVLDGVA